ncbi:MAG: hypothetical protein EXS69_02290 [Candidatus Zambryskibacteria bacterium]|nr:hypothetical protein [Candidatus Zambryskibacteria bacterium]
MKKDPNFIPLNELPLTIHEFLKSYNDNMPRNHPQVSLTQLQKFKEQHTSMFKSDGAWSLDQHRKRLIEWLPQNI